MYKASMFLLRLTTSQKECENDNTLLDKQVSASRYIIALR